MLLATTLTIQSGTRIFLIKVASSRVFVAERSSQPFSMKVLGETNTMKKLMAALVALSVVIVLTAASCGGSGGSSSNNGNGNDVHMGNTTFTQPSVTISKGSNVNLIDDVAVLHIISNGSWVNGVATPTTEPGAPTISNLQFNTA